MRPLLFVFAAVAVSSAAATAAAQSVGGHTLFGDFKVDESEAGEMKPISFDIILYSASGSVVMGRQKVTNNGRYRFMNLPSGEYDIVVEMENSEVARIRTTLASSFKTDFRQDIDMAWHSRSAGKRGDRSAQIVSAADFYNRTPAHKILFDKADAAIKKKNYEQALSLLQQIVTVDPKDYQAWTEIGTMHLMRKNEDEAERAYQRAVKEQPSFVQALVNLGRLRLTRKNFDGAIETLNHAVMVQPQSAIANYLLGEAYLQIKKGSRAVGYLNEAARLGRPEAHLRLATLYHAAGLKERAALEYEQFLAKQPAHPERQKLEGYIKANKKQ